MRTSLACLLAQEEHLLMTTQSNKEPQTEHDITSVVYVSPIYTPVQKYTRPHVEPEIL
jgi:hypothetical protein